MVEKARPLYEELRRSMSAEYDDSAAIGKRYRRQDEIGTPWALTIDEQTARRRHGHAARPRHARAGADPDRRRQARCCSTGSSSRGARARDPLRLMGWTSTRSRREALRGNPLGDPHERPLHVWQPDDADGPLPSVYVIQGMTGMARRVVQRRAVEASYPEPDRGAAPKPSSCSSTRSRRSAARSTIDSPAIGKYHTYLCDELVAVRRRALPDDADAAHRGIQGKSSGGYGAMITPLAPPDLFGGLATHAGDALFEVCYARDFAPAARALRDAYGGSFDAFWEDFRSGRPVLSSPYDELLVNTYAMCAAYSSNDDGTVDLPFDLETGELVAEVWAALARASIPCCSRASPRTRRRCATCAASGSTRAATTSTTSTSARPRSTARSSPRASRTSASTSSSSRARTAG